MRWVVVLGAAYYAAVVVSHDVVQGLAYSLQDTFTRAVWSSLVGVGAAGAGIGTCIAMTRAARARGAPREVLVLWWGSGAAALAATTTLLATNMEVVHFLQYALLAVPVLAIVRRFGAAMMVVTALGALDELYQWSVLHSGWAVRYDTNDVVLNAIGGALGCAAAAVLTGTRPAPRADGRRLAWIWGPLLTAVLLLGAGGPVLAAEGRLAMYREDWSPRAWITLSRDRRPETRRQSPEGARTHYVTHPGLALALCALIAAAFCRLDETRSPRSRRQSGSTSRTTTSSRADR